MLKKLASSKFLSGKIVEKDIYFFSSRLDVLLDGEYGHAVISAYKEGEFFYQERAMQVESVCIRRETPDEPLRASCVLPIFNSIIGFYPKGGGAHDEKLPSPASVGGGVMGKLRQIDGLLYAAGSYGCVFQRNKKGGWQVLDQGLNTKGVAEYRAEGYSVSESIVLDDKASSTKTINGRNGRVFCAGNRGEIYWLKEKVWSKVDSDTNANLSDIVLDDKGVAYICGWYGTLLRGDEHGFFRIPTNIDDYLNSMAFFNGELYVGGSKGLYKLVDQSLQPVRINQGAPFNCVELDAYDGELLVVSDRWFLVFDGVNWRRVDDPDNAEVLHRQ